VKTPSVEVEREAELDRGKITTQNFASLLQEKLVTMVRSRSVASLLLLSSEMLR
jgi:hypothetical protein